MIQPVPPFRRGPSGEIELQKGGIWLLLIVGIPFLGSTENVNLVFLREFTKFENRTNDLGEDVMGGE